MPFLRIVDEYDNEWGFEVPDGFIPAVGDTVSLDYGEPGEVADADTTAKVVRRSFWFAGKGVPEDERSGNDPSNPNHRENREYWTVYLEVELDEPLSDGFIASSSEWPSHTATSRRITE